VLLTGTAGLDQRVADELVRVLPPGSNVFLLGGTAALSPAVVSGVTKAGFHARRLSGANRFETAVAVADQVAHDLVIIADGRGFREALIASAAAASLGGVVVLTDGATLPAATDDFLAHDASRHLAIGLAAQAATGTERITAANPADLSVKVINRLLPGVRTLGVASQGTYADALAAAPYLAARHGGLLLTDGTSLSAEIGAELTHRAAATREVILLGGTGAISASTQAQIAEALSSSS
jgi:putative cell wall-binding protein